MSKTNRNNYDNDYDEFPKIRKKHPQIKEKRLQNALKTKNITFFDEDEDYEDYYEGRYR